MNEALKGLEEVKKLLQKEYEEINNELRVELPAEIQRAAALGDLSENHEYKAALERQDYLKARLMHIQGRLSALSRINLQNLPKDKSGYGSILKIYDVEKNEELTVRLACQEEADMANGIYSLESPIGKALLGKVDGDEVKVTTPKGIRTFEIQQVLTMHDQLKNS